MYLDGTGIKDDTRFHGKCHGRAMIEKPFSFKVGSN